MGYTVTEASIVIDGIEFKVPIASIERTADSLFKYAERTESGELKAELIGWYFIYKVTLGWERDFDKYEELYNKLTEMAVFHTVSLPTTKGMTVPYEAYFAEVVDTLFKFNFNGTNHVWKGLQFDVIARNPHIKE